MGGVGGVGWGVHSHYIVRPNLVLRLGWGFDNIEASVIITKCSSWLVQPSSAELGLALSLIIPTPSPTCHTGL